MGTTLDELKKLKDYELGALCYRFHIIPGHITEMNRPRLERKLIVAIMTARGKERARSMLQQRSLAQDNTSNFLPLEKYTQRRYSTLYKPSRPYYLTRSSGGGGGFENERRRETMPTYRTLSTINNKDNNQHDIEHSTVVLPTLKSASVTLNNITLPLNDDESHHETVDNTNYKPNDHEIQADGQILECELRTINYLSKEEEIILSVDRNSQEYQKRREAIINSMHRADFDDLDDYVHRRGVNSLDKVFSIFAALNRIGPFKQFNCVLLCCGVSLCAYIIYKKVK